MFPSYRNQSVDSKSTDWFLYDVNIGLYRVNKRSVSDQGSAVCFVRRPKFYVLKT